MAPLNQRKCHACGTWNDANTTHCSNCGELIDPTMRRAKARAHSLEQHREKRGAKESKTEKWIRKMRQSPNPFARGFAYVLSMAFSVYMAVLSFFIWLIAFFSG